MFEPCFPENEAERLSVLNSLNVLDTNSVEKLDRITRLAAKYFGVSIALISLIDRDRQWFLSRFGLDARETPRNISFCGHAILQRETLVVPDTAVDPRFFDNPLVTGGPKIGFYAGQPLLSLDGLPLGTLCIIDSRPQSFSHDRAHDLRDFAAVIEEHLHGVERDIYTESLKSNLQRTEALFEQTFSQAAVGMALVSLEGYWLRVNPRICEMLQYSERELLERTFQDITHPDDLHIDLGLLKQLLANEIATYSMEKRYYRADGSIIWVQLTVALNRLPNGSPHHFISVIVDISERKAAEADLFALQHELEERVELRTHELSVVVNKLNLEIDSRVLTEHQLSAEKERLRAITDNMPALISQIDNEERYLFANSAYKTWFGLDEARLKEMTVRELIGEAAYATAKPVIERALCGETLSFENELQTRQGLLMIHTTLVPCETQGFYILSMDITELKRLQQRLEYDVTHDMLTGLTNRRAFLRRLAGTLQRCCPQQQMALLFIDLDGFKAINDTFGHDFGDLILKTFAKLLSACAGTNNSASRLAGDEFTVILWPLMDPERQVTEFCEKVLTQLAAITQIGNQKVTLSASIGAAISSDGTLSAEALLSKADDAMYQAKSAGKKTYTIR
ncbi:diguanylate cyclase domain-containing protein [Serratia plymuthica]|uniref:Diguanylate cyclase n=1 Tax=Serratia plymuthica TaxID=82996 RepID=A0A2X4WQG1_SERPL|nr:diguanylate cyclase [Serratia plymuthica]QPS23037.1 diguanylate cyclase [Serratia plymuthica]QPS64645.1 diguanylate cyclase [Serratia plymuthica]CAI2494055.1 Probable diguanylate cyclase YdaM [Serratia plymuthica]SQI29175.1 Probable diguanylate cyclase YdaM [Serratia plymuthica]